MGYAVLSFVSNHFLYMYDALLSQRKKALRLGKSVSTDRKEAVHLGDEGRTLSIKYLRGRPRKQPRVLFIGSGPSLGKRWLQIVH